MDIVPASVRIYADQRVLSRHEQTELRRSAEPNLLNLAELDFVGSGEARVTESSDLTRGLTKLRLHFQPDADVVLSTATGAYVDLRIVYARGHFPFFMISESLCFSFK